MKQVSDMIRKFFKDFEIGSISPDPELLAEKYSDSFMLASQQGIQTLKRNDFLKVLTKGQKFFKTVGLISSKILLLEETRLDDKFILVKVCWSMQFEKDPTQSIVDEITTSYILYQQEHALQIVFQLDHQNLMKKVQDLGLLLVKD